MATPLVDLDPFALWREAVTRLEGSMNALGNQSLSSQEFTKVLHQFSTVSMQMQHVLEKVLGKYFKAINLPSRKDVTELAEALRRIEDKLDQLLPAFEQPARRPRPARTRRPAAAAAPEIGVAAARAAAAPRRGTASAKRSRKGS